MADLYRTLAKFDRAEGFYKRLLAVREASLGPDHPDLAKDLNRLAGLANTYRLQSKRDQAEQLYQHAMQMRERALGPGHPDIARSLGDLARLYCYMGKYEQAEQIRSKKPQ